MANRPFTAERQVMRKLDGVETLAASQAQLAGGGADTERILEAIQDLKQSIQADLKDMVAQGPAEPKPEPEPEPEPAPEEEEAAKPEAELKIVKNEVRALSVCIEQTKDEIAALYQSEGEDNRLTSVASYLDNIVQDTEKATGDILNLVEQVDEAAHNIRSSAPDSNTANQAEEIIDTIVKVFEACNFQDVTGQRITKVVNTLKFIDERISKIVEIWGEEDFLGGGREVEEPKGVDGLDAVVDAAPHEKEQISQDDIDALFD